MLASILGLYLAFFFAYTAGQGLNKVKNIKMGVLRGPNGTTCSGYM